MPPFILIALALGLAVGPKFFPKIHVPS